VYIVIAGGGKVGRSIAVDLLAEGHAVTIIERVEQRCEQLLRDHDLLVIHGDACDVRYLEQARLERADVFVATTGDDDDNFVACQLSRTSFGVPRVISRVNTPRNEEIFSRLDIEAVSTTSLISRLIREEVTVGEMIHLYTLRGGKVNLVEVDIPPGREHGSPPIADMHLPQESVIVCVFRDDDTLIVRGDSRLLPGDQVIALTTPAMEDELRAALLSIDDRHRA
jgi:trk system potassium uptake protein TrkA